MTIEISDSTSRKRTYNEATAQATPQRAKAEFGDASIQAPRLPDMADMSKDVYNAASWKGDELEKFLKDKIETDRVKYEQLQELEQSVKGESKLADIGVEHTKERQSILDNARKNNTSTTDVEFQLRSAAEQNRLKGSAYAESITSDRVKAKYLGDLHLYGSRQELDNIKSLRELSIDSTTKTMQGTWTTNAYSAVDRMDANAVVQSIAAYDKLIDLHRMSGVDETTIQNRKQAELSDVLVQYASRITKAKGVEASNDALVNLYAVNPEVRNLLTDAVQSRIDTDNNNYTNEKRIDDNRMKMQVEQQYNDYFAGQLLDHEAGIKSGDTKPLATIVKEAHAIGAANNELAPKMLEVINRAEAILREKTGFGASSVSSSGNKGTVKVGGIIDSLNPGSPKKEKDAWERQSLLALNETLKRKLPTDDKAKLLFTYLQKNRDYIPPAFQYKLKTMTGSNQTPEVRELSLKLIGMISDDTSGFNKGENYLLKDYETMADGINHGKSYDDVLAAQKQKETLPPDIYQSRQAAFGERRATNSDIAEKLRVHFKGKDIQLTDKMGGYADLLILAKNEAKENYALYGDMDQAIRAGVREAANTYGVSKAGGVSRIVRKDSIPENVLGASPEELNTFVAKSVAAVPGVKGMQWRLENPVRNGNISEMTIKFLHPDGVWREQIGPNGQPYKIKRDIEALRKENAAAERKAIEKMQQKYAAPMLRNQLMETQKAIDEANRATNKRKVNKPAAPSLKVSPLFKTMTTPGPQDPVKKAPVKKITPKKSPLNKVKPIVKDKK